MSNSDPFATPGSASGIQWEPLKGSLLLIEPHSAEKDIPTQYGDSDAIRGDVYVIDGNLKGEEYVDTLIFPKVLQGQLRSRIEMKVLGRLNQGNAKRGQSAPWRLDEATPADKQLAQQWLNAQLVAADKPPF